MKQKREQKSRVWEHPNFESMEADPQNYKRGQELKTIVLNWFKSMEVHRHKSEEYSLEIIKRVFEQGLFDDIILDLQPILDMVVDYVECKTSRGKVFIEERENYEIICLLRETEIRLFKCIDERMKTFEPFKRDYEFKYLLYIFWSLSYTVLDILHFMMGAYRFPNEEWFRKHFENAMIRTSKDVKKMFARRYYRRIKTSKASE